MNFWQKLLLWPTGGEEQYHTLSMCLRGDWLVAILVVLLSVANLLAYFAISRHWSRCEAQQQSQRGTVSLRSLRWIFILCGVCGYGFLAVKMWWPAWRLWLAPMAALTFLSWKFYFTSRDLKALYVGQSMSVEYRKGVAAIVTNEELSPLEARRQLLAMEEDFAKDGRQSVEATMVKELAKFGAVPLLICVLLLWNSRHQSQQQRDGFHSMRLDGAMQASSIMALVSSIQGLHEKQLLLCAAMFGVNVQVGNDDTERTTRAEILFAEILEVARSERSEFQKSRDLHAQYVKSLIEHDEKAAKSFLEKWKEGK